MSAWELSQIILSKAKESNEFQKSQSEIDWNKIIKIKWNKTSKEFVFPLIPEGIKNNGIFQHSATNRGTLGFVTAFFFIGFYILLYFFPNYIVSQILAVNGVSKSLSGNPASQWFLYGFMYCSVMTVFGFCLFNTGNLSSV